MRVVFLLLLLMPQLALARIYMCIDPATGETLFTDQACDSSGQQEEIRVQATNLDTGADSRKPPPPKTWNSERDQRKTGLDYTDRRGAVYDSKATAQSD